MPRCAQIGAALEEAAVRCAEVQFRGPMGEYTVYMGGVAEADFPDVTDEQFVALGPGANLRVQWRRAFFYGVHPELGPVVAVLEPDAAGAPAAGAGEVRSLAGAGGASPGDVAPGFFPAVNRNMLPFRLFLPNQNLTLESAEGGIVNEAVIERIPPFHVDYELVAPARYLARPGEVGDQEAGEGAAPPGEVVIETCRVKLMEIQGLKTTLQLQSETDTDATFRITIQNESTEDEVEVTWLIWPRPEEAGDRAAGVIALTREPHTFDVTLPRDIFFQRRWLAVSLSRPFETNAAHAGVFPALS